MSGGGVGAGAARGGAAGAQPLHRLQHGKLLAGDLFPMELVQFGVWWFSLSSPERKHIRLKQNL